MAQVKITVTDNEGKVFGIHDYDLASGLKSLSQMENAIEEQLQLSPSGIWNDTLLREKLEAGWNLFSWEM